MFFWIVLVSSVFFYERRLLSLKDMLSGSQIMVHAGMIAGLSAWTAPRRRGDCVSRPALWSASLAHL
jgi:hypothetical protein